MFINLLLLYLEGIPMAMVSHPFPLSFEDKRLDAGNYTLHIHIKDKNSWKDVDNAIDFTIVREKQ